MSYAQPVGNQIPAELLDRFERLGEPVVVHRLTRFEDPEEREAALTWIRQCQAARQVARARKEREDERRERRRLIAMLAAAGTFSMIAAAILMFGEPEPPAPVAASGTAELRELREMQNVLP